MLANLTRLGGIYKHLEAFISTQRHLQEYNSIRTDNNKNKQYLFIIISHNN